MRIDFEDWCRSVTSDEALLQKNGKKCDLMKIMDDGKKMDEGKRPVMMVKWKTGMRLGMGFVSLVSTWSLERSQHALSAETALLTHGGSGIGQ